MDQQHPTRVSIIGGGMAGLTAAIFLARAGAAVTVFEQAPTPGGRAATEHDAGFAFNRGIHALYCGGSAEQTLRELGITVSGHRPGPIVARDGSRSYTALIGAPSLLRTQLFDLADKWELARALTALPRIAAPELAHTSIADWIAQIFRRPRVRRYMTALAWIQMYTSALDIVSAEALIHKLQLALKHPILYIDGGWGTIVDGLRGAAEAAGATIVCGTHVVAIVQEAGAVTGVRLRNGATVAADAVVAATSPQAAARLMPDSPRLQSAVDGLVPAYIACLDVALRRLPRPTSAIAQDLARPCFLSAQSTYSRVAPDGAALVYTFRPLDPRAADDPAARAAELEDLLDAAQPGWRDLVIQRRWMPRIAALGALPLAQTGGYAGRPAPSLPDIAGLYVAGDWVGPGFLADASFASARHAAQLVLDQVPAARTRPERASLALAR